MYYLKAWHHPGDLGILARKTLKLMRAWRYKKLEKRKDTTLSSVTKMYPRVTMNIKRTQGHCLLPIQEQRTLFLDATYHFLKLAEHEVPLQDLQLLN